MKLLVVFLMILFLDGCSVQPPPELVLMINFSDSSAQRFIDTPEFLRLLDKSIVYARPGQLRVIAFGKRPIELTLSTRGLDPQKLLEKIRRARADQYAMDADKTGSYQTRQSQFAQREDWEVGTDHAEALRLASQSEAGSQIIVLLTDGFNEEHSFEPVGAELRKMRQDRQTGLILLGLTQGQLERTGSTTVTEKWRSLAEEAGFKVSRYPDRTASSYLISSDFVPPKNCLKR